MLVQIKPSPASTNDQQKMIEGIMIYYYLTRQDARHIVMTAMNKGVAVIPGVVRRVMLERMQKIAEDCGFIAEQHKSSNK